MVPQIVDKVSGLTVWKGKNVKHDELDLEVPINDVGGTLYNQDKSMAILTSNNTLRLYDVRGTNKRPIREIQLKAAPRSKMTKLTRDTA